MAEMETDELPSCSHNSGLANELKRKFDEWKVMNGAETSIDFRNEYQPAEIMKCMKQFKDSEELCDVEIVIDSEVIRAHRYILAAASPYFRAMFTNGMIEMKKTRIEMKDIPKESLTALIDFIYSNEITITSGNVQNLLFAASILQMDNIVGSCQHFLTKSITLQNCLGLRQFAELYNCTYLLGETDNFAVDNFRTLVIQPEFKKVPLTHIKGLLTRSDLNVNEESDVFEALMDWIEADSEDRCQHLHELFQTVRLPLLGWSYLLETVNNHPMIRDHQECRNMVSEALFEILLPHKKEFGCLENQFENVGSSQYRVPQSIPDQVSARTLSKMRPRKSVAGIIFCAGGRGTQGGPFCSVEAYDWRRNVWFSIADMTVQRRHVGVVSALGDLYAIGGHDGVTHLATAEVFQQKVGVWKRISPMNTARRGIAVAAIENAIYAVGGLDDSSCFKTVERYDIELDEWSSVADMIVQRGGVGVAALGKFLYAIGGNDGNASLDTCEKFDPLLDRWKVIARMHNRRAGAGVCVLDGYLYAIGGFDDNAPLATCERYDSDLNEWHIIANMTCPRGGVGVASMGGRVYAIGGHDGTRYLNTVEAYDPLTNTWHHVADIKECRAGAGVAWANCRVDQLTRQPCDSGCAPSAGTQCV